MNTPASISMRLAAALSLLVSLPTTTVAATFCVTDSSELAAALLKAGGNHEDDLIKVAPGTYTPASNNGFFMTLTDSHAVILGGGFEAAADGSPCGLQVHGAQTTILDGAKAKLLLSIAVSGSGSAPVTLFNFALRGGLSTSAASVVSVFGNQGWAGDVNVAGISVRGNNAKNNVVTLRTSGAITVINSEFVENLALNSVVGIVSNSVQSALPGIVFNNNTLTMNDAPTAANFNGGTSRDVRVANAIIQGNNQIDLSVSGANIFFDHSDIGTRNIVAGATNEANAHNGAPEFAALGDYSLSATSALRDAGDNMPVGGIGEFDVNGDIRVSYGTVDIGAHEYFDVDLIFRDSFEGP